MKESMPFKIGDKVRVSAEVMGYGIAPIGIVSYIESFMGEYIVSVNLIEPTEVGGRRGCTVTNLGMLTKL